MRGVFVPPQGPRWTKGIRYGAQCDSASRDSRGCWSQLSGTGEVDMLTGRMEQLNTLQNNSCNIKFDGGIICNRLKVIGR
jgi:hypothetical protein